MPKAAAVGFRQRADAFERIAQRYLVGRLSVFRQQMLAKKFVLVQSAKESTVKNSLSR